MTLLRVSILSACLVVGYLFQPQEARQLGGFSFGNLNGRVTLQSLSTTNQLVVGVSLTKGPIDSLADATVWVLLSDGKAAKLTESVSALTGSVMQAHRMFVFENDGDPIAIGLRLKDRIQLFPVASGLVNVGGR